MNGGELPHVLAGAGDARSEEVAAVSPRGTNAQRRTRVAVRQRSKLSAKAWSDTSVPHQPLRVETIAQLSYRCQIRVFYL